MLTEEIEATGALARAAIGRPEQVSDLLGVDVSLLLVDDFGAAFREVPLETPAGIRDRTAEAAQPLRYGVLEDLIAQARVDGTEAHQERLIRSVTDETAIVERTRGEQLREVGRNERVGDRNRNAARE